jgi:hypothetical protein
MGGLLSKEEAKGTQDLTPRKKAAGPKKSVTFADSPSTYYLQDRGEDRRGVEIIGMLSRADVLGMDVYKRLQMKVHPRSQHNTAYQKLHKIEAENGVRVTCRKHVRLYLPISWRDMELLE